MDVGGPLSRAQVRDATPAVIPPRLLASWRRSEGYGVPIDDVQPAFSGTSDDDSLFHRCGSEVLAELQDTLSAEPVGLMLTDADGLVLSRVSGDSRLVHALDAVHLAPGFSYSEQVAGTNGLGLALADRVPTLVRADEHYTLSLRGYTCAAAPVFDPVSGRLEGAVNLTTWSDARSDLLLALAQTAATSTANLMLARSLGRRPRARTRGRVFRIEAMRQERGAGSLSELSDSWTEAVHRAAEALAAGRIVAAVGEPGSGRSTLLGQASRIVRPRGRLLAVRAPAPHDVDPWLALWTPELSRLDTGFIVCNVDELPMGAADVLRDLVDGSRSRSRGSLAMSAERFAAIPRALAALVETVVEVPPLRDRSADVLPLAAHLALRARGHDVGITPAASHALEHHEWPGNVEQLAAVVGDIATRVDLIDVQHLPPELLRRAQHLPRIKAFERDEMIRVLGRPGVSIEAAAAELGMSRATVYRKLNQYGIVAARGGR